jgi:hypothetical protein
MLISPDLTMNSSTRLYERLGEIPQDPDDPESLEDLVVCAFGAFERYYVCWKTRGGDFRQGGNSPVPQFLPFAYKIADGYDLPSSLKEWLFPADGITRDFASLQVVFGRGDEYFASDNNGKLEVKEPEIKKPTPVESDELSGKQTLRRSRTMSLLRPLSDPIAKFAAPTSDVFKRQDAVSRSQSVSSQFRPGLWIPVVSTTRTSLAPRVNTVVENQAKEMPMASPTTTPTRPVRRSRPSSISFNPGSSLKIVEGKPLVSRIDRPSEKQDSGHCICSCHVAHPRSLCISTSTFISTDPIATISDTTDLTMQPELVSAVASKSNKSTILSVCIDPIPPPVAKSSKSAISSMEIDPIPPEEPKVSDVANTTMHTESVVSASLNSKSTFTCVQTKPISPTSSKRSEYISLSTQTEHMSPTESMLDRDSNLGTQTKSVTRLDSATSSLTDSCMQTDPVVSFPHPRTALRINTATDDDTPVLLYSEPSSTLDIHTPLTEDLPALNPVFMGRMMDYFSKPGYQLGDSLFSSYRFHQQPVYQEGYGNKGEWGNSIVERRQTV